MPTSTRARRCERHGSAGFTLLELAIVLFVVAIATSFVVPRLRDVGDVGLTASVNRLATVARFLYEEAAFRRRPMRLNLDLDKQAYWVTVFDDDRDEPAFVGDDSPLARPVALPDDVAFLDAILPAVGTVTEGVIFAQFFPEGYADPLVVHLQNRSGRTMTLAIEPLTGRARVADGRIELDHSGTGKRPRQRSSGSRTGRDG